MGGGILMPLLNVPANSWMIRTDGPSLLALAQTLEYALIAAIGVPLLLLMLAAIAGNMIQHRLVWSAESLKPKFSKVSPGAGFKRMFGKQALANFAKGLFKVVARGAVMTAGLWPARHRLEAVAPFDPAGIGCPTTRRPGGLVGGPLPPLSALPLHPHSSPTPP